MLIFCTLVGIAVVWVVALGSIDVYREVRADRQFERHIRNYRRAVEAQRRSP